VTVRLFSGVPNAPNAQLLRNRAPVALNTVSPTAPTVAIPPRLITGLVTAFAERSGNRPYCSPFGVRVTAGKDRRRALWAFKRTRNATRKGVLCNVRLPPRKAGDLRARPTKGAMQMDQIHSFEYSVGPGPDGGFAATTPYRQVFWLGDTEQEAIGAMLFGLCDLVKRGCLDPADPHAPGSESLPSDKDFG